MNTPENIFSDSAAYIGIIFLGPGASLFDNLFSGLLRAVGDSKTPLYFLCLSSALNVVLDLLFVVTFSMGVAGAAWATILSQGVSALLCLVYMLKKFPILRTGRADWAWHGPMVRRLARMGIPTALSNSVTAIGCMILQVTINGFGSTVVAAYTAASKVEQLDDAAHVHLRAGRSHFYRAERGRRQAGPREGRRAQGHGAQPHCRAGRGRGGMAVCRAHHHLVRGPG